MSASDPGRTGAPSSGPLVRVREREVPITGDSTNTAANAGIGSAIAAGFGAIAGALVLGGIGAVVGRTFGLQHAGTIGMGLGVAGGGLGAVLLLSGGNERSPYSYVDRERELHAVGTSAGDGATPHEALLDLAEPFVGKRTNATQRRFTSERDVAIVRDGEQGYEVVELESPTRRTARTEFQFDRYEIADDDVVAVARYRNGWIPRGESQWGPRPAVLDIVATADDLTRAERRSLASARGAVLDAWSAAGGY